MRFVDALRAADIGIIIRLGFGAFPHGSPISHGFARFDGTPLPKSSLDPREGIHRDSKWFHLQFRHREVQGFLIAQRALLAGAFSCWRSWPTNAVASMLYRDYSRKAGKWKISNIYGGARKILEAIGFLRHLPTGLSASAVRARSSDALKIDGVARCEQTHLQRRSRFFLYKWNMGWMRDTLNYITKSFDASRASSSRHDVRPPLCVY